MRLTKTKRRYSSARSKPVLTAILLVGLALGDGTQKKIALYNFTTNNNFMLQTLSSSFTDDDSTTGSNWKTYSKKSDRLRPCES